MPSSADLTCCTSELSMNAPDLFGVIVRTVGLCTGCYSLYVAAWMLYPGEYDIQDYLTSSMCLMAIGLILFLGANLIVTMTSPTYPHDEATDDGQPRSETPSLL
jgi:hypothetical protein